MPYSRTGLLCWPRFVQIFLDVTTLSPPEPSPGGAQFPVSAVRLSGWLLPCLVCWACGST
jgi:hypothetical protein